MKLISENQFLGVYVRQISFFTPDVICRKPIIEAYLVEKTSRECIKANSSASNLTSFRSPFDLSKEESTTRTSDIWNELLVFDRNISSLTDKILIFEIGREVERKNEDESGVERIAFAFLTPLTTADNSYENLELQLYKIRKDCKVSHQDCNIYHLMADHKLKKLLGYLNVTLKGVVHVKLSRATKDKKRQGGSKEGPPATDKRTPENFTATSKPVPKIWDWSRLPTQSCKVPNKIYKSLSLAKSGVSCVRFSRSGTKMAAAVLSKIAIIDVATGTESAVLNGHIGFIYELDWSSDDEYLLSVSNDYWGAVWDVNCESPIFVLPHPSFVYCGRWLRGSEEILTGGKDHLIRYWRKRDEGFHLVEEMTGHSGFVSALTTQDGSLLLSGDSAGVLMVRKRTEDDWTLTKKLTFPEMSQRVIDTILVHSSRRRTVVSVRSRGSYLVDFVSGIILQKYKSGVSTFARSVSCLTPCESYLFAFCQNGDVGVWEVNTGKLFASYGNLSRVDRSIEQSGCIHYHPHEHMLALVTLVGNLPLLILSHDASKNDDSDKLGLSFFGRKADNGVSLNFACLPHSARDT